MTANQNLKSRNTTVLIKNCRSRMIDDRAGLTLVEVAIATLIVGFLIVPTVMVFSSVAQSYYRNSSRDLAFHACNALLGEIMSLEYQDPQSDSTTLGPEADETTTNRSDFDDIDDYDGWSETSIQMRDGTEITGLETYSRSVSVHYVKLVNGELVRSAQPTNMKLISVNVTNPLDVSTQLTAIRFAQGLIDQKPVFQSIVNREIGLELQSRGTQQFVAESELLNQLPEQP